MSEHLVGFGCSIAAPPIWLVISRVATSSGNNYTQTQIIPMVLYVDFYLFVGSVTLALCKCCKFDGNTYQHMPTTPTRVDIYWLSNVNKRFEKVGF